MDYGDDELDDEWEWYGISFSGADLTDNRKYVVKEKLATFLNINIRSRHSIDALVKMVMEYVHKHAGVMERKYNKFLNFDPLLWDALEENHTNKIKVWKLKCIIEYLVEFPEPFEFEASMKAAMWECPEFPTSSDSDLLVLEPDQHA